MALLSGFHLLASYKSRSAMPIQGCPNIVYRHMLLLIDPCFD